MNRLSAFIFGLLLSFGAGAQTLSFSPGALAYKSSVAISTDVTGLGSGCATWLATPSSTNFAACITGETGTGAAVFATSPALTTPDLGTPTAGTLTNTTGFPTANLAGAGSGVLTWLATPSGANLATALTTALPETKGGTNQTAYTTGDLLYASASNTLSKLADVATGQVLHSGGVTTAPAWSALTSSDLPATISSKTLDNSNTVTLKDTLFTVQDDGDATKLLAFQLSGFTTGTTRTITIPNSSSTMLITAGGQTVTGNETFSAAILNTGITSDATHTDSTVCQDTTSHQFYAGSGTIGICLGTSSARYKNRIEPLKPGLSQIAALKPVSFFYNNDRGDNGVKLQYGFLAEDVVKVMPKLVDLDTEKKPNSVDILGMVPVMIHAMQEMQAEIDELKAQNAALKNCAQHGCVTPSTTIH